MDVPNNPSAFKIIRIVKVMELSTSNTVFTREWNQIQLPKKSGKNQYRPLFSVNCAADTYDATVLLEMPRCVIIGCRNGYKKKIVLASRTDIVEKESKFTLFYKPSDQNVSKVWEDKIPKEDGAVLPNRYAVCHEHFDESQIIKSDVTIINGE
ncbi:hypothetical protein OUZ56_023378 [Daphnia magna]|uniref:THAP-type domain-containing protein n=1 Tax=Daphnia magna TaxID=35525 RepID=A0ABR0AZ20_9CRUS|nr:hypothetical protein OUZ56_023378 [Daphnia magna]